MNLNKLFSVIETVHNPLPNFPPTLIYNEGWLLRLVMDWFSRQKSISHPLAFEENAVWFSDSLLPSAFSARYRGDTLAESRTHIDGMVGHFTIGDKGKSDFALLPSATQLIALEAKIYSKLSASVKNAGYYDQAARTVACIAEVLKRAKRSPETMSSLGFYVLAPKIQIDRGIFQQDLSKESIIKKVERRVRDYKGEYDTWYAEWFRPTIDCIRLGALSWDSIIEVIANQDPGAGEIYRNFLGFCLEYNG